jgi:outer membrane protein assembly factor BamA
VLQGKYRLGDSRFFAGLSYAFASTAVSFDSPPDTPGQPDVSDDSDVGGFTPSLTYDSRNNMFTPLRGAYVEATLGLFDEAFGGDDAFQRARLLGMQFFPLPHHPIYFGYRGEVAASFGDAPFYLRPFVYLRGAPILRYQGEEVAQLEAEMRWQFWRRVSVVGFAGYGAAWNDFERVNDSQTVVTGGTGIRYEIARQYGLHMGLDVAFGPENTAIYIQAGSAWARP